VVRRYVQRRSAALASVPLQTRRMPGFDIDLPPGRVAESGSQYRNGRLIMHDVGGKNCSLMLTWDPGGLIDDDAIKLVNKMLAATMNDEPRPVSLESPIAVPGPGPTSSWAFRAGGGINLATQVACGARHVILITRREGGDPERLHRRIAGSFRCRSDVAQERMIDDVPVVFGLGPGWFRVTAEKPELMLTNRRGSVLAFNVQPSARDPDPVKTLVGGGVFRGISLRERMGDDWLIEMSTVGKPQRGLATMRACPDPNQKLLLMSLADSDDDARELLVSAHCRKPNEPAETWPDLPVPATGDRR